MADAIFVNQKFTLTLAAKDTKGNAIDFTDRTIHFLTRDPDTNVATDTSPTTDDTNGLATHVYDAGDPGELDEAGDWMAKLLIDNDEVPSTRYVFHVYDTWQK